MITPSGSPPWVRTNTLNHYGGDVNKENYLSRGAIDATTDVDAAQFSRLAADMAAMQRVMPFCTMTLLCNDSSPGAPLIEFVNMQTGSAVNYVGTSAPSGFPSAARNGNGDVSITFASSYNDPYGVAGSFSISHVIATLLSTSAGDAVAERVSATVVRLRAFNAAGSAVSDARMSASIW